MRQPLLIVECMTFENSWNIAELFNTFCQDYELDIKLDLFIKFVFPVHILELTNLLYNISDIGISTSMGSTLIPFKHAGIGKPQILTNFGDLSEILDKGVYKVPTSDVFVNPLDMKQYRVVNYKGVSDAINYYYTLDNKSIEIEGIDAQETVHNYKWLDMSQMMIEKIGNIHYQMNEIRNKIVNKSKKLISD